jgi:hypothetical protein
MDIRRNEGVSLVIVLILGLIATLFVALIYKLTASGAKVSGNIIRYETALEAAKSHSLIVQRLILAYLNGNINELSNNDPIVILRNDVDCLRAKLERSTEEWVGAYSYKCNNLDEETSGQRFGDIEGHFDIKLEAGDYVAFAKIVNTKVIPVSGRSGVALTGVAYSRTSQVDVERVYTIHVVAKSTKLFSRERAWVTFVYAVGPSD